MCSLQSMADSFSEISESSSSTTRIARESLILTKTSGAGIGCLVGQWVCGLKILRPRLMFSALGNCCGQCFPDVACYHCGIFINGHMSWRRCFQRMTQLNGHGQFWIG